jgi:hypothetical protein
MVPGKFYDSADLINNLTGNAPSTASSAARLADRTYDLSNLNRFIDGRAAVKQAVVKILNTERFRCPVYSADYGIEFDELIGLDCDYVCVQSERRICEALVADERINEVSDFNFTVGRGVIHVSFTVHSVFGEFNSGGEFVYV